MGLVVTLVPLSLHIPVPVQEPAVPHEQAVASVQLSSVTYALQGLHMQPILFAPPGEWATHNAWLSLYGAQTSKKTLISVWSDGTVARSNVQLAMDAAIAS